MIITHETTIEQYEAWIAGNPSLNSSRAVVRKAYCLLYRAISRMGKAVKAKPTRIKACTTGKLVNRTFMPLDYDKNGAEKLAGFHEWRASLRRERFMTAAYIKVLTYAENDETNMFNLKHEALTIINKAH